ncbi:hypothetical protein [Bacillus sp. FJAT-27251]|nr:hypothetical protein [Bacillus sp. FJAT-27251]
MCKYIKIPYIDLDRVEVAGSIPVGIIKRRPTLDGIFYVKTA